jgi:hypothetical protein
LEPRRELKNPPKVAAKAATQAVVKKNLFRCHRDEERADRRSIYQSI